MNLVKFKQYLYEFQGQQAHESAIFLLNPDGLENILNFLRYKGVEFKCEQVTEEAKAAVKITVSRSRPAAS